jgi:hypothetical protein
VGHLSPRDLYERNQEGCLLYWRPRRICEGSGNGRVSIGAPLLGNMKGRSFPRAFEKRDNFSLFRLSFMRNLRDM